MYWDSFSGYKCTNFSSFLLNETLSESKIVCENIKFGVIFKTLLKLRMSRSALQKQFLKEQKRQQEQQQLKNATVATSMMIPPYYVPGYGSVAAPEYMPHMMPPGVMVPGMAPVPPMACYAVGQPMAPVMPVAPVAPVAPIPLSGDADEDDAADPEQAKANTLPMNGSTTNFNINNLLHNNIMENDYFRALYQLRTYHEVIDEIHRSVQHVEPWQMGTARFPSSAFCLLLKFMLMRLTRKQMNGLLQDENLLVRCIGLLYLRYTCPPKDLWKWFEPFLDSEEEFSPSADKSVTVTFGSYCKGLLVDMQYHGTTLPRIPVPIERKIKVMLLLLEQKQKRRADNLRELKKMRCDALVVGTKVRAIYSDEDNEPAWYDAVIGKMISLCVLLRSLVVEILQVVDWRYLHANMYRCGGR